MANKTFDLMHHHILITAGTLMETIPFSKISVKQICTAAEINRTTFYRHFEDKYQLVEFMLETSFNDLFKHMDWHEFEDHPFQSLAKLQLEESIAILDFQLSDPGFQDLFDNSIFLILNHLTDNKNILWKLGNMYVIRLWNHNLEKPYTFKSGYALFDQIMRDKQFPDEK
ncbi:transcriptional regulator TetR/AcrR family protein [Fructobacillus ficulneus]|uniref:Transcriptional regulator TetR/AcrR family protein n=2 Tax=Fructobacillus ficulneus TaxID=157463 RepID=A0A0K8MG72_9LACO|nr:transcriptional regulator TetR/AcrR family protein [Fructobacillus ficulneus]